jgi:hypothetical protein
MRYFAAAHRQECPMKTARYLKTDGTEVEISPANGKKFTLKELQDLVGGYIEMVSIKDRFTMVINEEGAVNGMPKNEAASKLWLEKWPVETYPLNNTGAIFGDVVVGKGVF